MFESFSAERSGVHYLSRKICQYQCERHCLGDAKKFHNVRGLFNKFSARHINDNIHNDLVFENKGTILVRSKHISMCQPASFSLLSEAVFEWPVKCLKSVDIIAFKLSY